MDSFKLIPHLSKGSLQQLIISDTSCPVSLMLQQFAIAGGLDEISNFPGSVRHHIGRSSHHLKGTNTTHNAFYFWIYQTGRHGPQNGFRLCLVNRGYHVGPDEQSHPDKEDDIDLLEKPIPQGHIELAILGEPPPIPDGLEDDASSNVLPKTVYDEVYVVPTEKPADTSHPA
ncbi:hypothetical protein K449DRAFT_439160 [Hypoxylon sp. EC38]|nr:hypothetical protein K449DRAFT_439160 [Hypoxylon sp. EC38]